MEWSCQHKNTNMSVVGDFIHLNWHLQAVGVEFMTSGSWSGVGIFRQLEWNKQLEWRR